MQSNVAEPPSQATFGALQQEEGASHEGEHRGGGPGSDVPCAVPQPATRIVPVMAAQSARVALSIGVGILPVRIGVIGAVVRLRHCRSTGSTKRCPRHRDAAAEMDALHGPSGGVRPVDGVVDEQCLRRVNRRGIRG